jgi:phosphoglycolate phosphatase-like HAD superfamily hydrolase
VQTRAILAALVVSAIVAPVGAADPLPSWNDTAAKKAISDFVTKVTKEGSPDFVPPAERIATFDNDGTLWCEQPSYFQGFFVFDRVKELAAHDPKLKDKEPFKAILESDRAAMAKWGEHELGELVAVTHSGMTPEEFLVIARKWLDSAKHPRFGRLYKECVYQPQLELLAYLRANGFKTFIVSGGGIDFIRAYAEGTYGIPPEQVVGSSNKTRFGLRDGQAELIKLPELNSIDDKEGKPINIRRRVAEASIHRCRQSPTAHADRAPRRCRARIRLRPRFEGRPARQGTR